MSSEGFTGGKWVSVCVFFGWVGEGFKSIFYLYQDLEKAPQIWKSLEFYPDQR